MQVSVATFNMENLFTRLSAMSGEPTDKKQQAIDDHATGNAIIQHDVYTDEDKAKLLEIVRRYKMHNLNPPDTELVFLQKIRGRLFSNSAQNGLRIVARGRADWVGWFELRKKDVSWLATFNTGRVIDAHRPDVLVLVEVENRPTFKHFNEQVLAIEFGWSYPHFMVVDGNDERGIDVGIASRFPIETIRSHVADGQENGGRATFSRDCPEFDLLLPDGMRLVVLANHFKSKRTGSAAQAEAAEDRREAQAIRANEIATLALARSDYVLIAGDLNDTPDSRPIRNIFRGGFGDVQDHPDYPTDRPGTYGTGLPRDKIDYLVMSPALRGKLTTTGIERRGSYHPNTWEAFPEVTSATTQASDHHLVWAKFEL